MKKSDLKKHIKEEILSILKEASTALVTTKGGTKPVSFSNPSELSALKTDANVSSITTTAGQKIKETETTEEYMISKSGSKANPSYVLEKPDGSKQIDMFFSSPEEAKKYAAKKNLKLSSKKGYNMNEAKEINGIPGTVTIGGGKSGILIPTNQGDYIYYVTDDEYNAFINAGGNAQKLMATIFLKSGKAKPYKPKYNPMASLGGGKGYHIDEDKYDDKITNLEKYTYTLNGKKVTPEIGYFDHSLKAMISTPRSGDKYFDYEFYRIGEPDKNGNIELSPEKGKKGMYTEAKITETVDMTELEYELKRLKIENPGKKVTYFFTKDNPKGYKIQIKEATPLTKIARNILWDKDVTPKEMAIKIKSLPDSTLIAWAKDNNGIPNSPLAFQQKLVKIEMDKRGLTLDEAKIESDFFEREPKSKDIEKGEGIITKTKKLLNFQKELKTLSKDMQDLAAEYKEAEGSDKDEILRSLKVKTAAKKELEKKIEQLEKYV